MKFPFSAAKQLIKLSLLGMAALSLCLASTIASPPQVYRWSGLCTDCAGTATATLTLAPTYVPGTPLTLADLVSFVYNPTDLIPAGFSITQADVTAISGSIPASLPAVAVFSINSATIRFVSQSSGAWCVGTGCPGGPRGDFGTLSSLASEVPEPSTLALIGSGLGLAALRRRRCWRGSVDEARS